MVRYNSVPTARIMREAMGPGFQCGPSERAMAMLATESAMAMLVRASKTPRRV